MLKNFTSYFATYTDCVRRLDILSGERIIIIFFSVCPGDRIFRFNR
jgi:hypothetical protein